MGITNRKKSPLVTMGRLIFAQKLPLPVDRSPNPTTRLIHGPVRPTVPNGIRIRSAVFSTMHWTERQTDRSLTGKFDDCRPLSLNRQQRGVINAAINRFFSVYFISLQMRGRSWAHETYKADLRQFAAGCVHPAVDMQRHTDTNSL